MNHHNHRVSRIEYPESSFQNRVSRIENPTLAHFRHFRHFSSLFTNSHLYIYRETSTNQLLFMQNKPNLVRRRRIANECKYLNTKDYENISDWTLGQNKPNPSGLRCLLRSCRTDQTQSNPISKKPK